MGRAARRLRTPEPAMESDEDRLWRLSHSRHGCAVEIRHGERRYLILTDHRGLLHAQEIREDGSLGEALVEDEFDALH